MAGRNVEFISLPVGFEKFHHQAFLNYQFNRAYGLGLADRNDLYEAGLRVRSAADCVIAFETGTASQVNHDAALRCEPVRRRTPVSVVRRGRRHARKDLRRWSAVVCTFLRGQVAVLGEDFGG